MPFGAKFSLVFKAVTLFPDTPGVLNDGLVGLLKLGIFFSLRIPCRTASARET
jgi:hypothetical protein